MELGKFAAVGQICSVLACSLTRAALPALTACREQAWEGKVELCVARAAFSALSDPTLQWVRGSGEYLSTVWRRDSFLSDPALLYRANRMRDGLFSGQLEVEINTIWFYRLLLATNIVPKFHSRCVPATIVPAQCRSES